MGAALGAVFVMVCAGSASADSERVAWIKQLAQERETRAAPASAAASATRGTPVVVGGRILPRGVLPAGTEPRRGGARTPAPAAGATGEVRTVSLSRSGRVSPDRGQAMVRAATAVTQPTVRQMDPKFLPTEVAYTGKYSPGTIVIDTEDKFLYLVGSGGMAKRYGVGVGRPGFQWAGTHRITMKREWPGWTPPPQMRKRQPELPAYMEGGPDNPLGARAMYLGSTLYRIHGSNAPWTIGHEVSSGCIRMRNEDVMDLYERVKVGTRVVVLR